MAAAGSAPRPTVRGSVTGSRGTPSSPASPPPTRGRPATSCGRARSYYRVVDRSKPGPPSINYVRGDRIVVRMKPSGSNDVDRVDMRGAVDGVQIEPVRQRPDSAKVDSLRTAADSIRRNSRQ